MSETPQQFIENTLLDLLKVKADVLKTPDPKLGDYSTTIAFILAKQTKKNPGAVAADLAQQFQKTSLASICNITATANGYVNFLFKPEFLQQKLKEISENKDYGSTPEGTGKTVIVEYSSPNIAKPMHIGHLRSTIIGDALANVYEALGYKVIRWNYIGDWGTQFGKLIAAYKKWGDEKVLRKDPVAEMLRLYVKFHDEMKTNPALEKEGQEEFRKLEEGDKVNRDLWGGFRKASLVVFAQTYRQLEIVPEHFVMKSESDYESELKPIIARLQKEGKIIESKGALIFPLEKYNLPPGLLRKSDGATLYLTRDLASLGDRLKEYKPTAILYVVANQQALYFQQLFAIAKELDMNTAELVHVKFGMVLGEDGKKLATREGKVVALQEVIDEIITRAAGVVKQKNPNLSSEETARVAEAVGIAALKYNDLRQHPYSDITFDWKAMLDLSGNSGPYLQYTYARLMNIVAKAGDSQTAPDLLLLTDPVERALMRQLLDFPDVILESARLYTLNALALYLYELAATANRFYETIRVLEDDNASRRAARLTLISTVARTLKNGLSLLGIQTLERI